jgi:AraC-like DNA-binding protein
MERLMFGDLVVDWLSAEANRVLRTARLARTSPSDAIQLTVLQSGRALVSQDDRTAVLVSPGDFVFVDTSRPFVYEFDARSEQVGVLVPRERLLPRLPALTDFTAVTVPGTSGLGALAASLLVALPKHTDDRTDPLAQSTTDTALELATRALQDHVGVVAVGPSSKELLLLRAQQFLRVNLRDPELTPADAARAISVSERYLFILFKLIGTSPASWLKNERLERAERMLLDPRHHDQLIQDIGVSVGFPQSPQFSRAFKDRFSVTPREHRATARPGQPFPSSRTDQDRRST